MKEYAKSFYKSKAWQRCRESYMSYVGGLCERCMSIGLYSPAEIIHHKIYISPDNITNTSITLDFNNLEALCRECHAKEHELGSKKIKRFTVDESGKVICI